MKNYIGHLFLNMLLPLHLDAVCAALSVHAHVTHFLLFLFYFLFFCMNAVQ